MARLLIEVETRGIGDARREMTQLESSIKGVEKSAATAANDGLLPVQRQIADLKTQLADTNKVAAESKRSFSSMTESLAAMSPAWLGVTAGIGAGTVALAGFVKLAVESSKYYAEQSGILKAHEASIRNVSAAWNDMRFAIGQAVVGGGSDLSRFADAVAANMRRAGDWIAWLINQWRTLSYAVPILGAGARDVANIWNAGGPSGPNIATSQYSPGAGVTPTAASYLMTSRGRQASGISAQAFSAIDPAIAERAKADSDAVSATRRLTVAKLQTAVVEEEFPAYLRAELAARMRVASVSGQPYAMPNIASWWFGTGGLVDGTLQGGALPGGGMTSLAPSLTSGFSSASGGTSWLSRIFGGNGLGSQAMSLLTGTGLLTRNSAVGRGIGGALTGFGLGAGISGFMSSLVGASVLGPLAPIGAAVGAAIPFISSLFGPSAKAREDAAVQPQIDQLIAQVLSQYGGREGLTAAGNQVGVDVVGAFGSKGKQGYAELSALISELGSKQADLNSRLEQQVELEAQIVALKEQQVVTWDKVSTVMDRYGLTLDAMGPRIQQMYTTASATQMINDIETLEKAGADVGGMLFGMRDQISKVVQESLRFGTEIPSNMRPYVEELARAGFLVDENGKKITDVSNIKWGDPVKSEAQKISDAITILVEKLDKLIESIAKDFPNAAKEGASRVEEELNRIKPKPVVVDVEYNYPDGGDASQYAAGGVVYAARGGYMGHPGRPRGTDTVPAWLTPGEYVMNRDAVNRIGVGNLQRMNSSTFNVGGIHVDVRDSFVDDSTLQRMGHQIERALMSVVRPQLQYSRY